MIFSPATLLDLLEITELEGIGYLGDIELVIVTAELFLDVLEITQFLLIENACLLELEMF